LVAKVSVWNIRSNGFDRHIRDTYGIYPDLFPFSKIQAHLPVYSEVVVRFLFFSPLAKRGVARNKVIRLAVKLMEARINHM
jgi:hypothetical protein